MLEVRGFPNCCGFFVLAGFPGSATISVNAQGSPETISETIRKAFKNHDEGAGFFATLDQNQRLLWHDLLLELGFRVVVDAAYSQKHFSLLTTYFRENHPMTVEEKIDNARDLGGRTTVKGGVNADKSFFDVREGARERFFGKSA